jgi:hypothetical protein
MDENRTLSILGWVMGSLLAAIFLLNAIAMSDLTQPTHPSTDYSVILGTITTTPR